MEGTLFTKAEADKKRLAHDWGSLTWLASKGLTQSDDITGMEARLAYMHLPA
jgi:hypothetical protein